MYQSIEQIQKLRKEKQNVLNSVYQSSNLDTVYQKQTVLGSMTITIYTDAANVIMPVLQKDGVNNIVWSNISLRLEKLSFISVPTAAEIREKYKKSMEHPTVAKIDGPAPKPGEKRKVKIELPAFLALLAATGIAVPLVLNIFGVSKWALVLVDAAMMTIEVVAYIDLGSSKRKKTPFGSGKNSPTLTADSNTVNCEDMCKRAIDEVYLENRKKLDDWFDALEKITKEEIDKALEQAEG